MMEDCQNEMLLGRSCYLFVYLFIHLFGPPQINKSRTIILNIKEAINLPNDLMGTVTWAPVVAAVHMPPSKPQT